MFDLARKSLAVIMSLEWAFCHSIVSEMTQRGTRRPFSQKYSLWFEPSDVQHRHIRAYWNLANERGNERNHLNV